MSILHRWTGGIVGLLLAVIGLSGIALVWEDSWIGLPGAGDPLVRDTAVLGAAVEAALANGEGLTRITFASEDMGLHHAAYSGGGGAYITQGGDVVARWDNLWGRPELWLFDLHHYLLIGETGKTITGVLGLLLIAFSITGLVLWWRTRRLFRFRLWPARWTASAIVRQHRDLGVIASPLLVLAGFTGAMMVFPAMEAKLFAPLGGEDRALALPADIAAFDSDTDWPLLMARAQDAFPDAATRRLMFPAEPGAPLALRLKQEFEWTPNGRTYVWLDPAAATVVAKDDPAAGSAASALTETFYPIHAGKVGGPAWRLALTFAGFALVLLGTLATWSFWFGRRAVRPEPPGTAAMQG